MIADISLAIKVIVMSKMMLFFICLPSFNFLTKKLITQTISILIIGSIIYNPMTTPNMSFMDCELLPFHAGGDILPLSCNDAPIQLALSTSNSSGTPLVELLDDATNEVPTDNLVYANISIDDSIVMSEAIDQVFVEPKNKSKNSFPEPMWTTHYWNKYTWAKKVETKNRPGRRTLRSKLGNVNKTLNPTITTTSDLVINFPLNIKLISLTKIKLYHTYCHTQNAIYCFNKMSEYVQYIGTASTVFDIDAFVGSIKITLKYYQSDILISKRQNKLLQEIIKLFTIINNNQHIKTHSLNRYERRTATQMFGKFSDIFEMFDLDSELIYTCQLFL
jgi:hypothetical protein